MLEIDRQQAGGRDFRLVGMVEGEGFACENSDASLEKIWPLVRPRMQADASGREWVGSE